jgi:hypothetical protein
MAGRDVVRDERRQTDAEVHEEAVRELERGAPDDAVARS